MEPRSPVVTPLSYALVLVLALELAVWGAFLVPMRAFGVPLPVGPAVAVVANVTLGLAGTRVLRRRLGGLLPELIWLVVALIGGTRSTGEDLVLPDSAMGLAYLAAGAVAAVAVLSTASPESTAGDPSRDSPSPAGRAGR